jgi:hypothetical protein
MLHHGVSTIWCIGVVEIFPYIPILDGSVISFVPYPHFTPVPIKWEAEMVPTPLTYWETQRYLISTPGIEIRFSDTSRQ